MAAKRKHVQTLLGLIVVFSLMISGISPLFISNGSEISQNANSVSSETNNPRGEDEWNITDTEKISNVSRYNADYHITITSTGKLILDNTTLVMTIDAYHPWNITVQNGGELVLKNSVIKTALRENPLRPFIKTKVSAVGGSTIELLQNSSFMFPGWVYLNNSDLTVKDSSFNRLPDDQIPSDFVPVDDNDDCPRLTAENDSDVLLEDSNIRDYYYNSDIDTESETRSWYPYSVTNIPPGQDPTNLTADDNDYYLLQNGDSLDVLEWQKSEYLQSDSPYINPFDRISALYIEVLYKTESGYWSYDDLTYDTPSGTKTALQIDNTMGSEETKQSDIWEIDLDEIDGKYKSTSGMWYLLKDLDVTLTNTDANNISIDRIRLISEYNNDINIWNSDMTVINSHLDVDFNASDVGPDTGIQPTNTTTWREDFSLNHRVIRLQNDASFKGYGINPSGSWEPNGDPILVTDQSSKNQTWIYRWVTVAPKDNTGTPVANTNVTAVLNKTYYKWPELSKNINASNDPYNNSEAWDYLNETGPGYFDPAHDQYVTDDSGKVNVFLVSDRINHPDDWPNSKDVGHYEIYAENQTLGSVSEKISLVNFPNLTASANHQSLSPQFDDAIPHPDLKVDNVYVDPGTTVVKGESINLSAQLSNVGTKGAQNVNLSFYFDNNTFIGSTHMDINSGETLNTSEVNWDYPDVGDYTIKAHVDPNNNITELEGGEGSDNIETVNVSIISEPDLTPTSFQLSKNRVYNDETITLKTRVQNNGEATAQEINVTFFVDWDETTEAEIGTVTVPAGLGQGDTSGVVSLDWQANMTGNYLSQDRQITVYVNHPKSEMREQVMSNNFDNETITIENTAELSVSRSDITFSTDRSQVGNSLQISADVYNTGGVDATANVTFYDGSDQIDQTTINLPHNDNKTATTTWTPSTRGNHEIKVAVGYGGKELNLSDNEASVIKPIFSKNYELDLIVNDTNTPVDIKGDYVSQGYILVEEGGTLNVVGEDEKAQLSLAQVYNDQFSMIIRDQGEVNINNAYLWGETDYSFSISLSDDASLAIKNKSNLFGMVNISGRSGNYSLEVINSDVQGAISLLSGDFTSYESNFPSPYLTIQPDTIECVNATFGGPLDDFHNTTGSLTAVDTQSIDVSGDSRIEIHRWLEVQTVSNGSIPVSNVTVEASNKNYNYADSGITNTRGITYIPVLTDIFTSSNPDYYSNYDISATYSQGGNDYSVGPISESLPHYPSDTHVYSKTLTFDDLMIPDLSVRNEDVKTNLSEVTSGSRVKISADIQNVGIVEASDITVQFYLVMDGEEDDQIGTENIDNIQAGDNSTASLTWTSSISDMTKKSETRKIKVVIDPKVSPIEDANIANNEAQTSILVKSAPQLGFVPEKIDIWMDDGGLVTGDTVREGDNLYVGVNVLNSGGTDVENAVVDMRYDGGQIERNVSFLPINKRINVTGEWSVDVNGQQTITIWLNSSEENPKYSVSIARDLTINEMTPGISELNAPSMEQEAGETIQVSGTVLRQSDDKPIEGLTVNGVLIDENGNEEDSVQAQTGPDGTFMLDLTTPEEGGEYRVRVEPQHENGVSQTTESFSVASPGGGIPLWLIALILIAVAGAILGGVILYLKVRGLGEWVECGECGATIPADSTECPECGTQFEMETVKCSECGEWIPTDAPECPHCGAEFITTGEEIEEYSEAMKKQYEKFVDKHRRVAKKKMGDKFTEDRFKKWWKQQPSYMNFDEWLEREEERRRKGGIECPDCGSLNPKDAAVCETCGSTLIEVERKKEERRRKAKEERKKPKTPKERTKEAPAEEEKEERKPEKKVKKKPQRVVKKVKKEPKKVEEEEEEEEEE